MVGLKANSAEKLNLELSISRILSDVRTDFIYAPHINIIYSRIPDVLIDRVRESIHGGSFNPQGPLTMEVIKSSGFSRPGSILLPTDRLIYQGIVDYLAPIAEKLLDRNVVSSNLLLRNDKYGLMFKPPSVCYVKFRQRLDKLCSRKGMTHVLKADVASYFDRIYQHHLVNLIQGTDADSGIVSLLSNLLSLFTGKDSHGIVQGVYPSDFLGNLYLCSIDAKHKIKGIPMVRFVDDMYLFFKSEEEAKRHKIELNRWLRKEGLNLNEAKTSIYEVEDVVYEEREIDTLFELAKNEIRAGKTEIDYYRRIIDWFHEELTGAPSELAEEEIELQATRQLFDAEDLSSGTRIKVDKFCLAALSSAKDPYAVEYVLANFKLQPHMAQIFARYLGTVCDLDGTELRHLENLASPKIGLFDFQLVWLYALLLRSKRANKKSVELAVKRLVDSSTSEPVRALCAIYVGKFGDPSSRRILKDHFDDESSLYVRAAILFSTVWFPLAERNSCLAAWSGKSELNSMVSAAIKKSQ